jgi:hypothetical protein
MLGVFGQTGKNNQLSKKEKKQGWVLLFDGITSKGWTKSNGQPFAEKGWEIKDGILKLADNAKAGDIVTIDEYSDFDFSVDFLMLATCNSGIKYFYYNYPKGGSLGMEFQLLDDKLSDDNKKANHLCGSLYDIFPSDETVKKMNKSGEWNTARIVSKGKHEEHWLNGIKVVEFDRGRDTYLAGVEKSKYKTEPVFGMIEKGKILLQDHNHEISFRNIKIRKL